MSREHYCEEHGPTADPMTREDPVSLLRRALIREHGHSEDHDEDWPSCHEVHAVLAASPADGAGVDVERLRALFRDRGWSIAMDDREGQVLDPFPVLAAALEGASDGKEQR